MSCQDPFRSPLQELVDHQRQVCHDKAKDVKGKELGGVLDPQLQPYLGLVTAFQSGVLHLTRDPVQDLHSVEKASQA